MAIAIKSEHEIDLMRKSGQILAHVHHDLAKELKEGMTTKDIDRLADTIIRSYGVIPNFLNYNGFPASVCVSVNDEVVHGIPDDKHIIKNGDIVSIDAGVLYKGYHSDAARTHAIGEISKETQRLIDVTRQSFFEGIKCARPKYHIREISGMIQDYAESYGFGVVKDLCGHGIGTHLHEEPDIPNFRSFYRGPAIKKGMCLAIEPMINLGTDEIWWLENDWTVVTKDGKPSAHYENTVAITEDGCEILTMLPEELAMMGMDSPFVHPEK